jgi:transcription elongation GreA/GreB family factor
MTELHDIVLSPHEAAALSAVIADAHGRGPAEREAAATLADALADARVVAGGARPVAALNTAVTYEELPSGTRRTVTLVSPSRADPAQHRISVFAPVARALIGRSVGARVAAHLPDGAVRELRVAAVEPAAG